MRYMGLIPSLTPLEALKQPVSTAPSAHRDWFRGGHVAHVDQCVFARITGEHCFLSAVLGQYEESLQLKGDHSWERKRET